MLKTLALVIASALIAFVGSARAAEATPASEPQYPTWLQMKEGYAEACAAAEGGCVPLSAEELRRIVQIVQMRTIETMCPQTRTRSLGPAKKLTSIGPTLADIE